MLYCFCQALPYCLALSFDASTDLLLRVQVGIARIIIMNLGSLEPYLMRVRAELVALACMQYFEPAAALTVFLVFFLLGRKSYESKFSTVLNTINDSENEKKRLKVLCDRRKQSLRNITLKSTLFKMLTLIMALGVAAYTYLKRFQPLLLIAASSSALLFWAAVLVYQKYLESGIQSTDKKLQQKLLSSENDAKEIINLLGQDLCKQLKSKFERELEVQARTQELKDCELKKCYDEKSTFKDLYLLYKEIIAEMQKMQWCDVCAQQLNTDANELKLAELELRLRGYKAASEKLNFERKKELTNKLLEQWQILEGRLPFICKRGCCIRFRHALDGIKKAYHERLKTLKNRLALLK